MTIRLKKKHERHIPIIVIDKDLKLSDDLNLFNNDAKTIILNENKDEANNSNLLIKIEFNNMIENILEKLYK